MHRTPTVALSHDWLLRYAGSERVLEQLLELYPGSPVVTTLVDDDALPEPLRGAEPSFLQRLSFAQNHHEWFVPLMPLAWRLRDVLRGFDCIIASSHACAHAVRVDAVTPVVCYCHTPMRYAWQFASEAARFPRPLRLPVRVAARAARSWDRRTAARVTKYVANSTAVADRIRHFYGRDAEVVHPPVDTEFFTPGGECGDYYLLVSRLVAYKRVDLAVDAFRHLRHRLLVVGVGPLRADLERRAPPNVEFLGDVDALVLRNLYRGARALIHPGEEDFGIAMAEAQACGTPVIAARTGGARDIVRIGDTGLLIDSDEIALARAVAKSETISYNRAAIAQHAARFSQLRFRDEIATIVSDVIGRSRTSGASATR